MTSDRSAAGIVSAPPLGTRAGYAARVLWVVAGVALIGAGSGLLRAIDVGVDPYTAANIGISHLLGMELGTYQLISNAVLFLPMLIWGRRYIGVGSIINMVCAGYAVQAFSVLLTPLIPPAPHPALVVVLFFVGICVFALGASLYMTAELGTAPYDGIAPMVVDATHAPYRLIRVAQDVLFLVLAVVFHGAIGVGTIVTAYFAGPLIEFFTARVSSRVMASALASRTPRQSRTETAQTHF